MSLVTNIILTCSVSEDYYGDDQVPPVDALNAWYKGETNVDGLLQRVDQNAGGYKAMEVYVFVGAANYLDAEAYIAAFRAQQWRRPEAVTLMLRGQDDDTFKRFGVHAPREADCGYEACGCRSYCKRTGGAPVPPEPDPTT